MNKCNQYSEEVEDLLIKMPLFLQRSGILISICLILLICSLGYFITYPITVQLPCIVISSKTDSSMVKLIIPRSGTSAIKKELPVNIRLDDYPYLSYGVIKANVIESISGNDNDTISLVLTDGWRTSFNTEINIRDRFTGNCDITIKKEKLYKLIAEKLKNFKCKYYE